MEVGQTPEMKKGVVATLSILSVLGILLVIAGVSLIFESDNIIHLEVDQHVALKNGSVAFSAWESPPSDIFMQFWMFDLQNVKEVIEGTEKPNVTEKGPYTYRELLGKKDIKFHDSGRLLSYRNPKSYVFERDLSVGPEEDTFTNINLPILVAASLLQKANLPSFLYNLVAELLSLEKELLFEKHTVHEFLWGYEEPLLARINNFTEKYLNYSFNTTVGLFTGPTTNGSSDGVYTVYTGIDKLENLNVIYNWNNKTSLNFWNSSYCNMINGTDGTKWHPFVSKSERLYIYSSDVCRSVYMIFNHTTLVHGIPTYHFIPPVELFEDPSVNPDNAGFCVPQCLESGVLDVEVCKMGAPIVVSQPHFYQGSTRYINAITGMHPDVERSTFLDVEPITGTPINIARKLQLNAKITKLKAFYDTANFNMTIFPMLWLNESGVVSADEAAQFSAMLFTPFKVLEGVRYAMLGVGACILLCVIIYVIQYKVRLEAARREQDPPLLRGDI